MLKLDVAEYMMSICGDSGLRDISSPGKSGNIFFLSQDDRFMIKTLKKYELKVCNDIFFFLHGSNFFYINILCWIDQLVSEFDICAVGYISVLDGWHIDSTIEWCTVPYIPTTHLPNPIDTSNTL